MQRLSLIHIFGTPVCGVLAMLNDMGVAASCEADTYGALSMYIGMKLGQHLEDVYKRQAIRLPSTEKIVSLLIYLKKSEKNMESNK